MSDVPPGATGRPVAFSEPVPFSPEPFSPEPFSPEPLRPEPLRPEPLRPEAEMFSEKGRPTPYCPV